METCVSPILWFHTFIYLCHVPDWDGRFPVSLWSPWLEWGFPRTMILNLYLFLRSPWWGWAFPRTVISAPAPCWGFCQSEACQCWPSIFSPLRRCRIYVPWNPWYPFLCLWWWCHPRLLSDPHRNLPRPWRGDEVRTRWGSSVPVSRSTIQPTIADWPELFMLATYRHLIDKNDLILNSVHVSEKL